MNIRKIPNKHFWNWFQRHHIEFADLIKQPKKHIRYWDYELFVHLRGCSRHFGYIIEKNTPNNTWELTITVQGQKAHFKKADALVAAAPAIPGWNISALEKSRDIDFCLEDQMDALGIDPRELYFSLKTTDTFKKDITVYYPLVTKRNYYNIAVFAKQAVYNLLGERLYGNEINSIEAENLSVADKEQLYKLETLPEYIGQQDSGLFIDFGGNLSF